MNREIYKTIRLISIESNKKTTGNYVQLFLHNYIIMRKEGLYNLIKNR